MMVLDGAALDLVLHGEPSDPKAYLARFGYDAPLLDLVADGASPLDVEVNHGRWIWICTCGAGGVDDPPSAGGVAFADCPIGWCPRCENADVGGRWRPLRFPGEREAIERLLALRPDPETRNWWPGETVDELARENETNGLSGGH